MSIAPQMKQPIGFWACWVAGSTTLIIHEALEEFTRLYFHHHPDNPIILHREVMINRRKAFKILQDDTKRAEFDACLLSLIQMTNFRVVVVVIDKAAMRASYGDSAGYPYHIGLGFLLQRFAGYLNHINRVGCVMAEARGKREDMLFIDSYARVYERGIW